MIQPDNSTASVRLPEILDLKVAAPLRANLIAVRGRPVDIDASGVERLGGLCLQVLLSAKRTWAADETPFRISGRSAAFDEGLATFGASTCFFDPAQE